MKLLLCQVGKTCESLGSVEVPSCLEVMEAHDAILEDALCSLQSLFKVKQVPMKSALVEGYNLEVKKIMKTLERELSHKIEDSVGPSKGRSTFFQEGNIERRTIEADERLFTYEEPRLRELLGKSLRGAENLAVFTKNSPPANRSEMTGSPLREGRRAQESRVVSFLVKDLPFSDEIDELGCFDEALPPRIDAGISKTRESKSGYPWRICSADAHSQQLSSLSSATLDR